MKNAQELRLTSKSIKQEVSKIKNIYAEEFFNFGGHTFFFPCLNLSSFNQLYLIIS